MKPLSLLSLVLVSPLAGCGGASGVGQDSALVTPTYFAAKVDHPFFPITAGRTWIYEGDEGGLPKREEVRTLDQPRVLQGVACTAIEERIFIEGVLTAVTTEWFAQDIRRNLWKFGEESLEFVGGVLTPTADSWVAGVNDGRPWMMLTAAPRVGEIYSGYRPGGIDEFEVVSVSATAANPAGVFLNCLEMVENPDDPADTDIILYASGVGRVSESDPNGRVDLVSVDGP